METREARSRCAFMADRDCNQDCVAYLEDGDITPCIRLAEICEHISLLLIQQDRLEACYDEA